MPARVWLPKSHRFSLKSLLSRSPVSCSSFPLSPRPRNPYLTSSPLLYLIETFSTSSFLTLVFWLLLGSLLTSPVPALLSSPPMAVAVVASPLCTWMAAACMSVACDEKRPLGRWSTFPGRRGRGTALSSGEGRGSPRRLISEFRASGIQGLMRAWPSSPTPSSTIRGMGRRSLGRMVSLCSGRGRPRVFEGSKGLPVLLPPLVMNQMTCARLMVDMYFLYEVSYSRMYVFY